jgi:Ino eighty subunit 1
MRINTLLNEDVPASSPAPKGLGRGNWPRATRPTPGGARAFKPKFELGTSQDGHSPSTGAPALTGPHGFYLPLNGSDPSHKRSRPLTQHQLAVEQFRRQRVDHILNHKLRIEYKAAAKRRRTANMFVRSWIRCKGAADGYDTDEESSVQISHQQDMDIGTRTPPPQPAGLVPLDFGGEVNDHGEESRYRAKMLGRALRRLERWEDGRAAVRSRPRGERYQREAEREAERPLDDDSEGDDDDDDMMDEVELRRDMDESSESSEDEMMDLERDRYDTHTLPPLPMIH